jgi:hypothetical protein
VMPGRETEVAALQAYAEGNIARFRRWTRWDVDA